MGNTRSKIDTTTFGKFVDECIHKSVETDWVSLDDIMNAFSFFVHRERNEGFPTIKHYPYLAEDVKKILNNTYNINTYGSYLYSNAIGMRLMWPKSHTISPSSTSVPGNGGGGGSSTNPRLVNASRGVL